MNRKAFFLANAGFEAAELKGIFPKCFYHAPKEDARCFLPLNPLGCSPFPDTRAILRSQEPVKIKILRPTRSQLESLQKQIQDGTYQPSATEIAARMLMIYDQED